jgi:AMMECR1 domain-containing protein
VTAPTDLNQFKLPVYVTWLKNGELRGCIGQTSETELGSSLQMYSMVAAVKDSRFEPIKIQELQSLSVEVAIIEEF